MNLDRKRKLIRLTTAMTSVGCVLVLIFGLISPYDLPAISPEDPGTAIADPHFLPDAQSATMTDADRVSLEELQRLSRRDLRPPLEEEAQPTHSQANLTTAHTAQALNLRLVGTAMEPGHSVAILQKNDGSLMVCLEGRTLEDEGGTLRVVHVEPRAVRIEWEGVAHDLTMPQPPREVNE